MEFKLRFLGSRMNQSPYLFMFHGTPSQKKLVDIFNSLPTSGGYVLSLKASALDNLKRIDDYSFSMARTLFFADIVAIYPTNQDERQYLQDALKIEVKN